MQRRNFLRGAATVAIGLPFLEGLAPRGVKAAAGGNGCRFIGFLEVNGNDRSRYWPTEGFGALTASAMAGTALEPLSGFASRMIVPRGIHTSPTHVDPVPGDGHMQGMASRLTASPLTAANGMATHISVDQMIAQQLNPGGRPALTLQVGRQTGSTMGVWSFHGPSMPAIGENNPWLAYQDLVGLSGLDDEALARVVARRESVLDLVSDDFETLLGNNQLSAHDRDKLDMHFTAIRDLEIDMFDGGLVPCEIGGEVLSELQALDPNTVSLDSSFRQIARLQIEVMVLAIACGATLAGTIKFGNGAAGPIYNWDGMNHQYDHHKLSHGNTQDDDSGSMIENFEELLHEVDLWHAAQFAMLLERLDSYTEGDGTVLDNSLVLWTNDLSSGLYHSDTDMPNVMAGSCGGYFQTGQHIQVSAGESVYDYSDMPHNRLLTTIANAVGCTAEDGGPITHFGDPNWGLPGEIESIKA
ncbi:MAG: DUF1552 domain-containing protein [Deltaproteobacteria bacterium]|nr:DUF1552 domain-containing protein [Deltaproteobacteria bacterium]